MKKTLKVAICIPSSDMVSADFCFSYANFLAYIMRVPLPGVEATEYIYINKRSSLLCASREHMVEEALARGAEIVLMLDSDQTFPPDTFHRLFSRKCHIIGANIALKQIPSKPSARMAKGHKDYVYSTGKTGIQKVRFLGCGVTMVCALVFRKIPQPWFLPLYGKDTDYVGEDVAFFDRAQEHGFDLYVDHDLSLQVGHFGGYLYTHKDIVPTN